MIPGSGEAHTHTHTAFTHFLLIFSLSMYTCSETCPGSHVASNDCLNFCHSSDAFLLNVAQCLVPLSLMLGSYLYLFILRSCSLKAAPISQFFCKSSLMFHSFPLNSAMSQWKYYCFFCFLSLFSMVFSFTH